MPNNSFPQLPTFRLLHKLIDSLHEIVCVLDSKGRFVYINQASFDLWGYMPTELIGTSCYELIEKDDREDSIKTVDLALHGKIMPVYENRYIRKDGVVINMLWEGAWDQNDQVMYCTGRDVSERKRLEERELAFKQELQNTRDQLVQLLDRITDGFIGLDENARIIYWNAAASKIADRPQEQMPGKLIWDVIPEPARAMYYALYQNVKKENLPIRREVFSDRLQKWLEINTYVSGSGLSIFFRDITEQKKLREQLILEQQHQQKRITAAVIKATEQERADVSKELHDNVNQVLTTVKLYTELCINKVGDTDQLLHKSMDLLQESINEIRGLSKRLSAPSLGKILLKDSINELITAINATNRVKIFFESHINGLEVPEEVHISIYRILQEHLTNVLKHSKAKQAKVTLDFENHNLILKVNDNGIGFDPTQKSSGIGIANMESRAENLKGKLDIISEPGKGCELNVKIPL